MRLLKKCDSSLCREIAKKPKTRNLFGAVLALKKFRVLYNTIWMLRMPLSAKAEPLFEALPQAHHPLPRQEVVHQQRNDHANGGI